MMLGDDLLDLFDSERLTEAEDDDPRWIDSGEIYARMEREFRAEVAAALPTLHLLAASRGVLTFDADGVEFALLADGRWARARMTGSEPPRFTLWERITRGDMDTRLDLIDFDELVAWSNEVNLIGAIRRVMSTYAAIIAQAVSITGYGEGGLS